MKVQYNKLWTELESGEAFTRGTQKGTKIDERSFNTEDGTVEFIWESLLGLIVTVEFEFKSQEAHG